MAIQWATDPEFQSAPRLSEGGNNTSDGNGACAFGVSIRPPPFGRGKRECLGRKSSLSWFQSAPRLSEGGNVIPLIESSHHVSFKPTPAFRKGETTEIGFSQIVRLCFNPPPAFRKGETITPGISGSDYHVSIRPPPFGRGKPPGNNSRRGKALP